MKTMIAVLLCLGMHLFTDASASPLSESIAAARTKYPELLDRESSISKQLRIRLDAHIKASFQAGGHELAGDYYLKEADKLAAEIAAEKANPKPLAPVVPAQDAVVTISPKSKILVPIGGAGRGKLTVDNGTSSHAIVKLINTSTDKKVCSFYIRPIDNLTVSTIADGQYKLIFCFGGEKLKGLDGFEVPTSSSEFRESLNYITDVTRTETPTGTNISTSTSAVTITLHEVVSGKAKTDKIPLTDFDKY